MISLDRLSDILLIFGTVAMSVWCYFLFARSEEKSRSSDSTESYGELSELSERIESLRSLTERFQQQADREGDRVERILARADERIGRIEILLASLEDVELAESEEVEPGVSPTFPGFRSLKSKTEDEIRS